MWIVRGWLHPARPEDIPAEVAGWLPAVANALDYIKARNGG